MVILAVCLTSCRSAFFIGEDGEYLIVIDKDVPHDSRSRTRYTVKNVTQEKGFLLGNGLLNIYSSHVFHVGDTVKLYRLDSPKGRGAYDKNVISQRIE